MDKMKLKLPTALTLANSIANILAPMCSRILVVGSIRRQCAIVSDIDIALVARPECDADLRARIRQQTTPKVDGASNVIVTLRNGVQLDVFFAHDGTSDLLTSTPPNWGSVVLCRTGSALFNVRLAQRAHSLGLQWETMRGITRNGEIIASRTEEEMFKALEMDYLEPQQRR